ncbi:Repetin [Streptomyces sp. NPDC050145]|uniref:Repetin n=1 Tax=Streptomyces sp. NPDC050145 TaxID=3365602 RepID=UPI0037A9A087
MARTRILVATALTLLVAATGTAAATVDLDGPQAARHQAASREAAALTGTAKLWRPAPDEDITFTFDAHLAAKDNMAPEKAYGTFSFSHYRGGKGGWAKGRIDCLMTGGKTAVMTGIVTESDTPFKGKRVGISVTDDGRRDRLGYTWSNPDQDRLEVPRCMSAPPFEVAKKGTGDFKVLPWKPEYPTG